jgi:hypothetical protein
MILPATEFLRIAKLAAWRCFYLGRQAHPVNLYRRMRYRVRRDQADDVLARFSAISQAESEGNVLVDAMWDNPNYWIRYVLLRAALGLASAHEVGLLGPSRARLCRRTLVRFGIQDVIKYSAFHDNRKASREQARRLLSQTGAPEDILQWRLPHDLPPDFIYDGILKRQRGACVNLKDPWLSEYVVEALDCIAGAERILDTYNFDLLVLSHVINFRHAPLAWFASQRGIPIILIYGNYGVARFAKMKAQAEVYDMIDRPSRGDLSTLRPSQVDALVAAGSAYLKKRKAGQTSDIGAIYAYQRHNGNIDRATILKQFQWREDRPILAVYASNWFDFPHTSGMMHFRDFLDWLLATVNVAIDNQNVNWLFKAHPCDDWYGGITLTDLMPPAGQHSHVQLVPKQWDGSALMDCVDGLVTYHGTAGIEYAALGKPVLVADRGWYHDFGFVKWPRSRAEYLQALASEWWKELNLKETTRLVQIFAGWYFCRPAWQGNFVLEDDSVQDSIYEKIPELFANNSEAIERELETMRDWFSSDCRHYHTYKMSQAEEYAW